MVIASLQVTSPLIVGGRGLGVLCDPWSCPLGERLRAGTKVHAGRRADEATRADSTLHACYTAPSLSLCMISIGVLILSVLKSGEFSK